MTLKEATRITGGLSWPSKMPCPAYSLPSDSCKIGRALRTMEDTPCSKCYARKGRYNFPNVKDALDRRLNSLEHPDWREAMVALIKKHANGYFRWHDSGDLQSFAHLCRIDDVAANTPNVIHFLPTKEYSIVEAYLWDPGHTSPNLNIRLSSPVVDFYPKFKKNLTGIPTSVVISSITKAKGPICPGTTLRSTCDDCRLCWQKTTKCVCYLLH